MQKFLMLACQASYRLNNLLSHLPFTLASPKKVQQGELRSVGANSASSAVLLQHTPCAVPEILEWPGYSLGAWTAAEVSVAMPLSSLSAAEYFSSMNSVEKFTEWWCQ